MKTLTKIELENLYFSLSTKDLCKMLEISLPTLLRLLKNNGIENKGRGNFSVKRKVKIVG
jgi:hypothetical protein